MLASYPSTATMLRLREVSRTRLPAGNLASVSLGSSESSQASSQWSWSLVHRSSRSNSTGPELPRASRSLSRSSCTFAKLYCLVVPKRCCKSSHRLSRRCLFKSLMHSAPTRRLMPFPRNSALLHHALPMLRWSYLRHPCPKPPQGQIFDPGCYIAPIGVHVVSIAPHPPSLS